VSYARETVRLNIKKLKMVALRRKLLDYALSKDEARYQALIKRLDLRLQSNLPDQRHRNARHH
jgi:hypothetical protein